ncbi:type III secretion system chaperone family protein [Williamsia sterculiae]|uniref:Putative sensory transduction regulator n=1 Tax=Williamsia sterculiae TaxID=1344003 RepID=A0A1N7CVA1_9NOCA|nr:YbjN domain-containing protein [Williamsia sterculiae]SIR67542.1 Putative sensory transduction regulator [Williamsia sterculiae]
MTSGEPIINGHSRSGPDGRPPAIVEQSDRIQSVLRERGVEFSVRASGGADTEHVVVELPGERKLKTTVLLTVGKPGVRVEAFVCRHPDENTENVFRYLLKRNRRLYGVAYTIDNIGDIYLVGRISAESVTPDELDRILGQVLEAADGDFNTLLELGFATSIRREWAWRVSRRESLNNLLAFEHLIDKESLPAPGEPLSRPDQRLQDIATPDPGIPGTGPADNDESD